MFEYNLEANPFIENICNLEKYEPFEKKNN